VEAPADDFFALTPERVLTAVEVGGRRATGYALALNSLENRVYEVELEDGERVVVKFYRPARWTREQILEEHALLAELVRAEVPTVAPIDLGGGATLGESPTANGALLYAVWPKVRGRAPDELDDEKLAQLGRLVARLHHVGAARPAPSRPTLDAESYGAASARLLLSGPFIPLELERRFRAAAEAIVASCARAWPSERIRLHGDCHLGNLLHGALPGESRAGWFFLDFDDFLAGPAVQDLWLLAPGRDDEALRQRELVVSAYETMRAFDRRTLRLVEPLRALRILRYAAWIAQRWRDPAFQRTFPGFDEHLWWQREVQELEEQRARVERALEAP
jgi:Ser/Thr protein kinase RdoA (MazF antagonist)